MNVFWIVLVPCFTAFLVPESVPIGHVVGYISGKPEVSTQPRYFVVFPDEQTSKFLKVDEASGEISTVSLLDYEKRSRFEILAVPVQGADGIQIIVDVDDENDNAPKFADESLFLEISEYAHIGSEFALPVAFDGDGPKYDVHKYHIVQGNVNNVFKISTRRLHDVLYADLVVNGQLDREYRDKYELLVEALDGGNPPKSGQLRVSIKILDANDNAPLFTQSRYSTTVAANISVGSTIVTVKATDADTEQNARITYHLKKTNSPSNLFFSISSSSGVLTTTGHLLPASVHDVIVVASDGGSPSLQSTAVVSVVVQGATLTPPAIDLIWLTEASAAHLLENATLGSIVARVSLNEEHKDCVLELSGCHSLCLQQTDSAHVYLLLVCGNFDRETTEEFHLKFSLKRDNAVVLEHPLLLTIGDVNDNWPLWRSNPVHLSLNRTVGGGRILSASDADLGQNGWVRYSVLDTNLVSIDADTGRLFIPKELDCDVGQELRFRVRAEDGGVPPLSSDLQVTADLLDLESRPPTFEKALYELEVPEDTPIGTCLVKVSANNSRCGGSKRLRYSIQDGAILNIDSISGTVCVEKSFDYETQTTFQTNVIASNSGGESSTALVSIRVTDVNDNAPVFYPQIYNISAREGELSDSALLVVSAVDADRGVFGQVRYALMSDSATFYINISSGELFAKRRLPRGKYHLIISAVDGGGLHAEIAAHVHILVISSDAVAPVFTQLKYVIRTTEDILPGIVIGSVAAVAPNPVRYSIYSGDPEQRFAIQENTGKISVTRYLDSDLHDTVLLNVQADVEGGGSNHTQVLIHIEDQNDNAPKFSSSLVEIVVREDQPSGEAFYVVHAIDKDRKKNGRVRYSLLSSHPPSPVVVDGVTGQLILKGAFDHESVRDFKIRVKAQDEGIPPKSSNITVVLHISDVNDNAPIFERHEYRAEVVENSAAKIEVAKIVARDADSQENGQVLYRVTNGSEYFGIDEKLGTLYTKRSFDREIIDHVDVTVVAEDRGMPSHSTTTHVRVDVLDVNDNSPSCQSISALVILSTAGPSSVVGTIVAVDPDKGLNGSVVYRSQIQHSLFIVKANGDVQLRRPLKESDASDFRLSVIASDQGVPRKSSVCHVAIKVSKGESDVILTEPFARSISLPENCSSYCRIESFHATGVAKWQLQSSELSNHFVIREGVLSLMSVPSHRPPYTLTLILSDSQGRQKHVPIRIHALSAKNQQPPIRLQDSMAIGARIGSVGESSSTGEYFYKPLNSSNCPFALDESSGALYLAEKIREPEVFTCLFQRYNTTDGVAEEFSVDFETTSNQLDKPVFENWTVRTTVRENVSPGSVIATMNASASDSTTVNYRFREESLQFSIDQFTGAVSLVESLHWHEASVHLLVVEAFVGARSTSSVLIVEVEDINDCAPQFLSESDVYVAMSERRGVVHRVVATDKDSGMNGRVRFELAEKHSSFSVDEKTGELSIGQASVFPQNITIRAYDYGSPPMSSQQILNIRVLNESRQRWHHFDEEEYVIDVDINTREDAVVYSFDGTLPLRLVPESSVFRLRGANIVVCSSALQPQEHRFTIVAESDRGVVDWAPVFVRVLRPAAPPPRISSTSCGTVSVEEGRSVNSVKRVFAVDAAKNATYRIQGVKPDFSINSANGVISMNALDRENLQEHLLVVIVEDGGKNDSCTVRVVVTDINDNEPQFAVETPQELLINSSRKVDDVIFRFRASDMDIGSNGKITFELIEDQSNALDLIPETGDLVLRRFPAAGSKEWMIRVRVADQGSPPMASERFIRMKNDLAAEETLPKPAFLRQSYISSVDEGLPRGQLVAKVATNFGDSPVTYSIVEGNLDSAFSVGLDGVIRTAQELDREIVERYHLKLIGTGQWAGQIETQVVVRVNNVNDNPPSFPAPRQKKVSEALPVGSYVFTVVANDVDGLRPLEYSLTNKRDLFHIDRFTGVVHLQSPLDYELEKEHVIRVNVTDGLFSATTTTTVVVLDANDNAPVFAKTFYDIQTEPLISLDTPIARIQAHDVDDGQNAQLVYFLADDEKRFKIAPDNGTLYFTHFPARNSTFLITAVAKDRGSPPLTSSVAVRVTVENATKQKRPVFSKPEYEFDVPENVTVSTVIGNISNEFDFLTYRVVDVEASKFFFVDRLGRVSVQQNLDRESRDSFTFLVEVDSETATEGRGASTARVVVRIKDVNDNSPVFGVAPIVFLRDGLQRGDVIAQLSASDEDFGENGRVSYRIFAGNDYGVVSLNSESGALLFNEWNDGQLFDYPDGSWSLLVEAHDHGKPSRWSTLTIPVTLKLTSWSGTAPFFVLPSYDSHVLEDTPLNSVIAHVKASNRYGLPNRNLIYSIKDNTDEKFGIDSSTGEMRLKSSLDWESASFYSMFVSVSDSHGRSAVVPLKIFVEPVDEYAPVFISNAYRFKVPITREIGDAIGEVQAVDEDGGKHGIVSYRIADLQSTVSIDPVTGVLSLRKSLGKRKNTTLEQITVVAMSPAKQSTTTVLFEFGQFANTSQLLSFFQLKYVQIFCLATVLLLFCLLIVMISCMACKNRDAENVPKKEIYSVEKRKLSDHPKPAIFNARAAGKACSMTSSSSMNSSAIRRVDLVSTRSHVDSGIDPDTVSVNSSVTDYLVSIGVNPNPIPARLKTNTTYDSLNNSILNEYIYARVDDVIPPGPINLSRTLDMMDPPRSTYSTQRPHAVPSFQPLTEIFSEIAEMQREERQRQYVQVEI